MVRSVERLLHPVSLPIIGERRLHVGTIQGRHPVRSVISVAVDPFIEQVPVVVPRVGRLIHAQQPVRNVVLIRVDGLLPVK